MNYFGRVRTVFTVVKNNFINLHVENIFNIDINWCNIRITAIVLLDGNLLDDSVN